MKHKLALSSLVPAFDRLLNAARQLKPGIITGKSDLAKYLNESPQTITNWQSRGLPRAKILDIAKAIGIRAEWLLDGTGPMTPYGWHEYETDDGATQSCSYIQASSAEDLAVQLAEKGNEEIDRVIRLLLMQKNKSCDC